MAQLLNYSIAFTLIGFAGFVDSIAGGGGLITIPTYLFLGLPPQVLLGTNKLVSATGASLTVFRYSKVKAINWKRFRTPALLSFLAAIVGACLSRYQSKQLMLGILFVVTPIVFLISLRKPSSETKWKFSKNMSFVFLLGMAILLGGYDGFFGPGTGSFLLFGLLYLLKMNAKESSANARILNYASNLGALLYFSSQFKFDLPIASMGIVASLIGNYLGSHFVIHHAARVVRPLFLLVLIGLMLKLVWDFA